MPPPPHLPDSPGSPQAADCCTTPPEAIDFYRIVRGQLEHEDNLITNRTNWLLTSQSFLFTAYAIITNGYVSTPRATPPISNLANPASAIDPRYVLLSIIPLISIAVCFLTFLTILAGVAALRTLHRFYETSPFRHAPTMLPPVQGYRATRIGGVGAPLLLPLLFIGVWIFLLAHRLF